MFSFSSHSLKDPKPKKSGSKETIFLPLPIPIHDKNDKNLEQVSKTLPGQYTAILKDKRVYVTNEWESKILFNCGYFGKGEYSRGEPSLNKEIKAKNTDEPELSINFKNLVTIDQDKFEHKKNWYANIEQAKESQSFDCLFKTEFSKNNIRIDEKRVYYKINIENEDDQSLVKTVNNMFNFKIKSLPNVMLNESLNLMYEEAFFLSFGLDCLNIYNENNLQAQLSIEAIWSHFCSLDKEFPFKYAVYHKLRSKGWVIKYGIKYGCDYLVYYEGPDRYHASYSVKIKIKDLNLLSENEIDLFTQFSSLVRINETASKELMLIYVIYDQNEVCLNTPKCLSKISILEMFVNRWTPEENRDNETGVKSNNELSKMNFQESLNAFQDLDD